MTKPDYKELLQKLSQVIEESLELLKQAAINDPQTPVTANIPVISMLDQCVALCEQYHADVKEPIRLVHHFGLPANSSLLPSLATLPNTRLLTDINPGNSSFKEMLKSQTLSTKSIGNAYDNKEKGREYLDRQEMFLNDLQFLQQQHNRIGQRLLVCNNHCSQKDMQQPDLQSLLRTKFETKSIVIVIEPVVGYQAYCDQNEMKPPEFDFEQYCQKTLDFIETHPGLAIVRHEDFMVEPAATIRQICEILELPFNEDFLILREVFE